MTAASVVRLNRAPITICSDLPADRWDCYVQSRSGASAYHLKAWAGVIERAFGHQTRYLAAECRGEVVGILPVVLFRTPLFGRFAVSMPFVNYGGVVADTPEAARALLEAGVAEARAARAAYLELRHSERLFPELTVKTHKVAMTLPLQRTKDDQWRVLDRKLRNQVRKAEKEGLESQVGGIELVDAFHDVLAQNMRDLGSPVHSPRFFKEILAAFPESTRIFLVKRGSLTVAGSLVLWHRDRMEVPWASSLRAFNSLCPNVLLYWNMVRFADERQFACFDFGRSTPLEGTYQFKKQWGAEPHELYWEYWLADQVALPDRGPTNPKFAAAVSLWRRLPVSLTRLAGPLIVRNIP